MPTIGTNKFLGYSSKHDAIMNEAVAQGMNGMIINKGDLCNHPYEVVRSIAPATDAIMGFVTLKNYELWLSFNGIGTLTWALYSPFVAESADERVDLFLSTPGTGTAGIYPPGFGPVYGLRADLKSTAVTSGNWFEFGDWAYLLANSRPPAWDSLEIERPFTRMLRVSPELDGGQNLTGLRKCVIGTRSLQKINKVEILTIASYTGTYQFSTATNAANTNTYHYAITMITPGERHQSIYDSGDTLEPDALESNAVTFTDGAALQVDKLPRIEISPYKASVEFEPPAIHLSYPYTWPTDAVVGVYAKESTETTYKFIGYHPIVERHEDANGDIAFYIYIRNFTTVDHFYPTDHYIPSPCTWMVEYRDRIYSNIIADARLPWDEDTSRPASTEPPLNTLQVSPSGQEEILRHGTLAVNDPVTSGRLATLIPNYVNGLLTTTLGEKQTTITGGIVYFGQLILFKRNRTYVLDDDIALAGEIRVLFSDKGCVNAHGGKGYLVHNDILYFVSTDGVYAWSGQDEPVRISEPIQEDLEAIETNRYTYCRLNADPRYNLVYLTFPVGPEGEGVADNNDVISTFIYHPNEGGVWTTLSYSEQISEVVHRKILKESPAIVTVERSAIKVFMGRHGWISQLGLLESEGPLFTSHWTSAYLSGGGDQIRLKHWKELLVNSEEVFEGVKYIFFAKNNKILATVGDEYDSDFKNLIHLGFHSSLMGFTISVLTTKPFRINGYEITYQSKGIR